jgi:hypothetical protein
MSAPTPVRRGRSDAASPLISRRGADDGTVGGDERHHGSSDPSDLQADPAGDAADDLPLAEFDEEPGSEPDPARRPRGPNALDRLDDRVVPALQRGARRASSTLATPFALLVRAEDRLAGGRIVEALWSRRAVLALVTAALFFAGTYAHLVRYEPGTEPGEAPVGAGVEAEPVSGATIGPAIGQDLGVYEDERRDALADASDDADRWAVVSFGDLLDGEEAEDVLGPVEVGSAQLIPPGEGQEPFEVPVDGDLAAAVTDAREAQLEEVAAEEEEFRRLLDSDTITDAEYEEFYTEELERLAAVRQQLDDGVGTVFAVVVEADVSTLRQLQEHGDVRLVDLAPEAVDPGSSTFYGLLPSDTQTASWGTFR